MAGIVSNDDSHSFVQVRRIKHWVMLNDETARQLMEIVRIEQAWGRQVDDEEVLAAMVSGGIQIRRIEAHIRARG
jgi:hypothetical protein